MNETLPYSWYTDDQILQRERALIFARSWQYAGRAAQVAEPGSFLATDAGGIPILVVRGDDGELRAFLNVCRHRGAVLTEGCGTRSTIQCRYHAWTYDLDGSLRTAPRSEREPGFDKTGWSLIRASSARIVRMYLQRGVISMPSNFSTVWCQAISFAIGEM